MSGTGDVGDTAGPAEAIAGLIPTPVPIVRRRREAHDTFTIEVDASALAGVGARFAPGRFLMLYAFGVGEVPVSISGNVDRPERLAHTIRGVGAVTNALATLRAGDTIGLRGPYGVGWPLDALGDRDVIMVAGGLGIAPLKPAIDALIADRRRRGRLHVLIGARTPHDLLFAGDRSRWNRSRGGEVRVTVDRATPEWTGEVGVVPGLLDELDVDVTRATALICGPEVMMRFTVRKLLDMGLDPAHVWVSMERSMRCAVGLCGHCQLGPEFLCKDGPVLSYARVGWLVERREV